MADSSTLENASEEKKVERLSSPIRIDSRNEVINEVVSTRVQGVSVGTERPQITEPFLPSQLIINEDETAIFYHPDRPWYNSLHPQFAQPPFFGHHFQLSNQL
jgi:hypothetical protein